MTRLTVTAPEPPETTEVVVIGMATFQRLMNVVDKKLFSCEACVVVNVLFV